jgi:CAAX prenyl protease-like protein
VSRNPAFSNNGSVAYLAPFAAFVVLLTAERAAALPAAWFYPLRLLVVFALLLFVSRPVISLRAAAPLASAAVGIAVFAIWVAPDVLFGPGYRHHWLFENPLTGSSVSSVPTALRDKAGFALVRALGCTAVVPVIEELFWRGWLIRWLDHREFLKVPLGACTRFAFWSVAILFAAEHGPYWEVGLAAGIIYNWWLIRTKNLADCIVAHAVTNGLLSVYVLLTGQWQYWL